MLGAANRLNSFGGFRLTLTGTAQQRADQNNQPDGEIVPSLVLFGHLRAQGEALPSRLHSRMCSRGCKPPEIELVAGMCIGRSRSEPSSSLSAFCTFVSCERLWLLDWDRNDIAGSLDDTEGCEVERRDRLPQHGQ